MRPCMLSMLFCLLRLLLLLELHCLRPSLQEDALGPHLPWTALQPSPAAVLVKPPLLHQLLHAQIQVDSAQGGCAPGFCSLLPSAAVPTPCHGFHCSASAVPEVLPLAAPASSAVGCPD